MTGPTAAQKMAAPDVYLLVCRVCDRGRDAMAIPFSSPAERGKWAAEHTRRTGHDQWWVHDGYVPPEMVPEIVARLDMPAEVAELRARVAQLENTGRALLDEITDEGEPASYVGFADAAREFRAVVDGNATAGNG